MAGKQGIQDWSLCCLSHAYGSLSPVPQCWLLELHPSTLTLPGVALVAAQSNLQQAAPHPQVAVPVQGRMDPPCPTLTLHALLRRLETLSLALPADRPRVPLEPRVGCPVCTGMAGSSSSGARSHGGVGFLRARLCASRNPCPWWPSGSRPAGTELACVRRPDCLAAFPAPSARCPAPCPGRMGQRI